MGTDFTGKVYRHEPEESYQLAAEHLKKILPKASAEQIRKILKQDIKQPTLKGIGCRFILKNA